LTTFFKESLNKDYLTDEMEIYSKMYDGVDGFPNQGIFILSIRLHGKPRLEYTGK
jgi:hypothetical protein